MSPKKPSTDLDSYRAKRSPDRTPEPFGGSGVERPRQFVVQQHAARRLHWDLRLEMGGVLRSWAVPKGPSLDPAEMRLAVMTEDHPVEYADFEGVIPEGNYGAGAMIIWDRGQWISHLDLEKSLADGKLLFDLKGFKLHGLWTLVRTTRNPQEWLLIKKPDGWAIADDDPEPDDTSVLSGLTVEELAQGPERYQGLQETLEQIGTRRRPVDLGQIKPMLATLERQPFSCDDWLFELKYDGYRLLGARSGPVGGGDPFGRLGRGDKVALRYRSGRNATATFPEIARALSALPYPSLVLDGEVVVLDDEARPDFGLLQQRGQLVRRLDIERAAVSLPATWFVFDLLALGDHDLRRLPLVERKQILRELLPKAGPIRYADHIEARGEALYEQVQGLGLEGMVAKRLDSDYRGGRSRRWIKVRAERTGDFAVVGYTLPKTGREGLGALHLAAVSGGRLVYAGRVGTGFSTTDLKTFREALAPHTRAEPAAEGELPTGDEHHWVEPRLVVEVAFTEITRSGQLRHPVYRRLRDDKQVRDCTRDDLPLPEPPEGEVAPSRPAPEAVAVTRPKKIFWADEGYTKGDLFAYYEAIAPWLMPFLRDRPLVLDRYPDGIRGKSFYQKNAPEFAPDWIRTEEIASAGSASDEGEKLTEYLVCDTPEALLYVVNLGAIPLHVWSSRLGSLQHPDWCILDLDPKKAPFGDVVRVAREIHRLCESIGLPSFPKTSGGDGLHVLLPLGGLLTYGQSRQLAEAMARIVVQRLPKIATVTRAIDAREDKVYVDYIQNGYGKLLVAPFSVRPYPGAKVSTPLAWREVTARLDPARFHIRSVPDRVKRQRSRLLEPILETTPDLGGALASLYEQLD